MNSLSAPQELHAGDQLVSNNGFFVLEMLSDGSLSLYRKQLRWSMWGSPALNQPGGFAVMQGDGNFVCYSPAGVPYWASNTDGHPAPGWPCSTTATWSCSSRDGCCGSPAR
jgi:hypothetical protein